MFNNCNSVTNGELFFLEKIKDRLKIVFDVGCREDSLFLNIDSIVHYFEPNVKFYNNINRTLNKNKQSIYNCFGLGNENKDMVYYENFESFIDRTNTCGFAGNEVLFTIKKASDYISENNIKKIDFLKIDVEGYELDVIKGFGDKIENVEIIQFEYGGTYKDANIKLIDVIDYLSNSFCNFYYLDSNRLVPIEDFTDHYQYSNIVCFNKKIKNLNL